MEGVQFQNVEVELVGVFAGRASFGIDERDRTGVQVLGQVQSSQGLAGSGRTHQRQAESSVGFQCFVEGREGHGGISCLRRGFSIFLGRGCIRRGSGDSKLGWKGEGWVNQSSHSVMCVSANPIRSILDVSLRMGD